MPSNRALPRPFILAAAIRTVAGWTFGPGGRSSMAHTFSTALSGYGSVDTVEFASWTDSPPGRWPTRSEVRLRRLA
ncbi:hypothetical protein P0W64_11495 [Tsukamurella sp. 8F]|uniref:hypothetical protein n=1 Tax=unclassified Tsukamurella TaxID=2633480 RepID=UPI0023B92C50|nr:MULTISPECIES: hypothetical protein [unclassified Tsukamurella]MDF0529022.1 hypothetical protein [Tsukamurella sp. 8J]MDF0587395.1 hypothetical protein [Tsukamurella sp. 8F]